ncbi:MAG: hypothetical protein KY469_07995 [Actinobacteria bacterium]|nr:hypothetical protein [Actinomycetota bacterium]
MSDTRGPRPGRVPPHVQERLFAKRERAERRAAAGPPWRGLPAILAYVVIAVLIGLGIGVGLASDSPNEAAAEVITEQVVPIANEGNAVWTVGTADRPAVAGLVEQGTLADDVTPIIDNHEAWSMAINDALTRLEAVEVPAEGAAVHALYLDALRLTSQAIEVLGAAAAHEGVARNELLVEASRLRAMAEAMLDQATRALVGLQGGDPGAPPVAPILPPVTGPTQDPAERFAPPVIPTEPVPTAPATEAPTAPAPDGTDATEAPSPAAS